MALDGQTRQDIGWLSLACQPLTSNRYAEGSSTAAVGWRQPLPMLPPCACFSWALIGLQISSRGSGGRASRSMRNEGRLGRLRIPIVVPGETSGLHHLFSRPEGLGVFMLCMSCVLNSKVIGRAVIARRNLAPSSILILTRGCIRVATTLSTEMTLRLSNVLQDHMHTV